MAIRKTGIEKYLDKIVYLCTHKMRHVITVIALILGMIGAVFGYMMWVDYTNQAAQRDFGFLVMEYDRALESDQPDWQRLQKKFERAYEKHANSTLVSYYKDYGVNILLEQHKLSDALALLDSIIESLPTSQLLSLYQLKKALLLFDYDAEKHKEAQDLLIQLSRDQNSQFADAACFYLGRYYWSNNDVTSARQVWQALVDDQKDEMAAPSPWALQAKRYLNTTLAS